MASTSKIRALSKTAVKPSTDDYIVIDGDTTGTRKMLVNNIKKQEIDNLGERLNVFDTQLETITQYKSGFIYVVEVGCDNTGANDCTAKLQEYINNGYSLFFPQERYKCNLVIKPNITILGEGLGLVTLIPNDKNNHIIYADLSAYNYTIKDISIDGLNEMGKNSYTANGIYLSGSGSLAQQDLEPHLENIKIVNVVNGLKIDDRVRGGLFKNIKAGACVIGINHLSTDCIFKDCITAQTQKHGFSIIRSNNTFVNCKAFLAGLGKVEGAGIKLQGSYNRLTNCECQQNVLESLQLQNANSNIVQGCILDGSGYNSKTWFPDLTYAETGGTVPISILRIYNSNSNIIDCTIINGRIDSYSKCGLYNQYVGNDSNNDIRLSIKDTDTSDPKPFVNYQLDDEGKYFKNNRITINGTVMKNRTILQPTIIEDQVEITSGGYIVDDGKCYIFMTLKALKTQNYGNEILKSFPAAFNDISLSCSKEGLRCYLTHDGKVIYNPSITENDTFIVSGSYIIK